MRRHVIVAGIIFAVSLAAARADDRAWYGFHIKPETAGFPLNPTVRSVVIDTVKVNSPAAAQRIQVGDEILEADGKTIPGARALQLISLLNKEPGSLLRLQLRRADGERYTAVVRGIKKPGA
jgi:C-terminal processing protease CtpA/Prc